MKKKSFRKKLSRKIRHKIRAMVFPDHVNDHFLGNYPFDLKQLPNLKLKSFGDKNPDKNFLVIWRDNIGSGFFANFLHAFLSHLDFARNFNFIPVIDCENFPTIYNVEQKINDSKNSWEYYFQQTSPYSLEEVYQSKNVFFASGYNIDPSTSLYSRNSYQRKTKRQIIAEEISLKPNIINELNKHLSIFEQDQDIIHQNMSNEEIKNNIIKTNANHFNLFNQSQLDYDITSPRLTSNKILGVHFRGKDMNSTQLHPFGPTLEQIFRYTDQMLEKYSIDKIFLACEDLNNFEKFINRYPKITHYFDSYRTSKINAFNIRPRENHRYLLGLEVLVEGILLGKCSYLLRSSSNIADFAKIIGNHKAIYYIDNGTNSKKRYLARIKYPIKKNLPKNFFGLKDNLIIEEN